jgi:hypothetical protein
MSRSFLNTTTTPDSDHTPEKREREKRKKNIRFYEKEYNRNDMISML